jgi:hypothetical protein
MKMSYRIWPRRGASAADCWRVEIMYETMQKAKHLRLYPNCRSASCSSRPSIEPDRSRSK